MNAGELDRLIRIEFATETLSARGEPIKAWPPDGGSFIDKVAAKVILPGGREAQSADQTVAKGRAIFSIRYRDDLAVLPNPDDTCRVIYQGRTYDVLDVREVGRRAGHEIDAEARAEA